MASKNGKGPAAIIEHADVLAAGTKKNIVGKMTIPVVGQAMDQAQILAALGTAEDNYAAVTAARSVLAQALATYEAGLPALKTFIENYEAALKALFGPRNPVLADFGLKPKKNPVRTTETKAKALAKLRETRDVRGTLGRKERLKVTAEGTPGLALVKPGGQIQPGLLTGPTPPGASEPVTVAGNVAPATDAAPAAPAGGSGNTPSGK